VAVLNHRVHPKYIYDAVNILDSMPFLIIENKVLYTKHSDINPALGYEYEFTDNLFPDLLIKTVYEEPSATIICYGGVLIEVEDAILELAIEHEIFVDIVCPTIISHINFSEISKSLQVTGNLLIVEEGSSFASWGSEVVAKLSENDCHPKKISRISNNDIIPSSFIAESRILPNKERVISEIIKFSKC
ncbi:hypothetical protein OAG39_02515, partial [Verrucomicrobiales bacterium]|nr:hypothetical protein [Verrucomicrobiales bacterium]